MQLYVDDYYNCVLTKKVDIENKYKDWVRATNFRDALAILWLGGVTEISVPRGNIPGYDFTEYMYKLMQNGIIDDLPTIEYRWLLSDVKI